MKYVQGIAGSTLVLKSGKCGDRFRLDPLTKMEVIEYDHMEQCIGHEALRSRPV